MDLYGSCMDPMDLLCKSMGDFDNVLLHIVSISRL